MNSKVIFLFFCAIANHLCFCAPRSSEAGSYSNDRFDNSILEYRNNDEGTREEPAAKMNKLIIEIKAGLRLAKVLPSEISERKVTEAAVVLGQVLTTGSPALHLAVENALQDVILNPEDSDFPSSVVNKLLSYLANLKHQISLQGDTFPQKFSDWLKRQIVTVESTIQFNIDAINKLGKNHSSMKALVVDFESKVAGFRAFIRKGLDLFLEQASLQSNVELTSVRNGFKSEEKYYRVSAGIVWDILNGHQVDENTDATSISFLTALREVTKREIPDLQPMPQAVLRTIRIFYKRMPTEEHTVFLAKLGQWSILDTTPESSSLP